VRFGRVAFAGTLAAAGDTAALQEALREAQRGGEAACSGCVHTGRDDAGDTVWETQWQRDGEGDTVREALREAQRGGEAACSGCVHGERAWSAQPPASRCEPH
jgi:hypothetical protein